MTRQDSVAAGSKRVARALTERSRLPAALHAEVIELLAQLLQAEIERNLEAYLQDRGSVTVAPPRGSE